MLTKLAIICPCYNEEEVLKDSASKLEEVLDGLIVKNKISSDSFILLVDDGSQDSTWNIIKDLHNNSSCIKGVHLAFNSGHQFALMAGMMDVVNKVNAAITIDVDLQNDISCIEKMVDYYNQGFDVVYAVKHKRKGDKFLKKFTAKAFYKFQQLMGINIIPDHADFRLVSNNVLKTLSTFNESNLYLRGIIPSLGFKAAFVNDEISKRSAGKSKYTGKKMMKLATDGITSFSSRPLKIIFWIGIIFLIVALDNAVDVFVALANGTAQPGWSQLMLSVWFVGGVIMITLGLVGIYIGKIYSEVKKRPQYIISEVLD